ncbi:MAG: hypothetical protein GC164_01950 [Phycisphaera sp.]|nr:hypothetical protein [Phycisphaera sp.]
MFDLHGRGALGDALAVPDRAGAGAHFLDDELVGRVGRALGQDDGVVGAEGLVAGRGLDGGGDDVGGGDEVGVVGRHVAALCGDVHVGRAGPEC